jgi:hypothetical protein
MSPGKVAKNAEFGPPRTINDDQFDDLIAGFGIEGIASEQLVDRLQLIVAHFQEVIGEESKAERERTRKSLRDAANWLAGAAKVIGNSGATGKEILRMTAPAALSPVFDLQWLQERFPDDILGEEEMPTAPLSGSRIRRRIHSRVWSDPEHERHLRAEAKYSFVQSKGQALLQTVLQQMSSSLSAALELSKSAGGRTPITRRREFLVNLAAAWRDIVGRNWKSRGGQDFGDFCSAVFEYVGWPTTGLEKAIEKALADKRLSQK